MPLDVLIAKGSLVLIFIVLIVAGLGVPIPEDIPLVAAGVLSHQGAAPFWVALLVCFVGVLGGDLILFLIARRLGTRALERPFFAKLLPPARRAKITKLFERWGGGVIFMARHVVGLRGAVFAFAGMHQMPLRRFLFWDFIGLCVSAPWMMGIGYWFADNREAIEAWMGGVKNLGIAAFVLITLVVAGKLLWNRWRKKKDAEAEAAPTDETPPRTSVPPIHDAPPP